MTHYEAALPERDLDPEDWEAMRALGHRMVDDMLDYLRTSGSAPPGSTLPTRSRPTFDSALPLDPQPPEEVYEEFLEIRAALPGRQHPSPLLGLGHSARGRSWALSPNCWRRR